MTDKPDILQRVFIAQTYLDFCEHVKANNIPAVDPQYIQADDVQKLAGRTITPDNLTIIGDPVARWSFWQRLITETNKHTRADKSEPDISKCPRCGGEADNGHDRCYPPNPYNCTKCESTGEPDDDIYKLYRRERIEKENLEAKADRLSADHDNLCKGMTELQTRYGEALTENEELLDGIRKIASCEKRADGDCVDIAQALLKKWGRDG